MKPTLLILAALSLLLASTTMFAEEPSQKAEAKPFVKPALAEFPQFVLPLKGKTQKMSREEIEDTLAQRTAIWEARQAQQKDTKEKLGGDKLYNEINKALFPLRMHISPMMFSRRFIPDQREMDFYAKHKILDDKQDVYLSITVGTSSSPQVHYADARYSQTKKEVNLGYTHPISKKTSWVTVKKWIDLHRPAS